MVRMSQLHDVKQLCVGSNSASEINYKMLNNDLNGLSSRDKAQFKQQVPEQVEPLELDEYEPLLDDPLEYDPDELLPDEYDPELLVPEL